jgi:ketopantoate reductase
MRIAIYTGGAGGYFGAQLACSGEDVMFVARGQHLKAIQAHGLDKPAQRPECVAQAEQEWNKSAQKTVWRSAPERRAIYILDVLADSEYLYGTRKTLR